MRSSSRSPTRSARRAEPPASSVRATLRRGRPRPGRSGAGRSVAHEIARRPTPPPIVPRRSPRRRGSGPAAVAAGEDTRASSCSAVDRDVLRARRTRSRARRRRPLVPDRESPVPIARDPRGARVGARDGSEPAVAALFDAGEPDARTRPAPSPRNCRGRDGYIRSPPSSCAAEVRRITGHVGHGLLAARSRWLGRISSWTTARPPGDARCRGSPPRCLLRR